MLGSGLTLITTITGFAISATFILFVCVRLICGRLHRLSTRLTIQNDSRIDLESPERQITSIGSVRSVVAGTIPTMKFHREAFGSTEDPQCPICLEEYQEKEVLRIMPKCGHTFHLFCIDIWLRKHSTCPVCRLSLHDSFEARHVRQVTYDTVEATDSPRISIEHSQQVLLSPPASRQSGGDESSQMNDESNTLNIHVTDSQEARARS